MTVNGGQEVHFVDHGGDGPAVVLLHSFLMDHDMWLPQVEAFRGDHRLIAIDERGHGDTPADGPFDYWDVARDALAVLDHLGFDQAAVIGTSQGGFVGLRMALLAPERVTALAVLGTSADAENPEVAALYRQLGEMWAQNGPDEVIDGVAAICFGDGFEADGWKAKWRERNQGDQVRLVIDVLAGRDSLLGRLGEIQAPVLVLHGTADRAYPIDKAEELVAGLPNAKPLITIDDGAHFLSLTHAAEVNPHLKGFLATHAAAR
ncbi:alpha/beta hydrolase [Amycolatopsis rhabdoformis]|uniref:Alpha/beta hydrolase n=1 Tax=Amycolatopsis rhabdoformis TaxID=1448059 RepID=A0ABZ1I6G3_9PSEU|nr:alpha/beta hydrolase [Amycolatopsis rhabdoformis]WSE29417.1 alpha/beta hydrolase [Amycolatopsis rhabdoformis]